MAFLLEKRSDNCQCLRIHLKTPLCKIGKKFITALSIYKNVSLVHALLFFKDKSWYIQDLESTFGVFVNFVKIGKNPVKLKYWNVIGFGSPVFNSAGFVAVLHPPTSENTNVVLQSNSKIQLDVHTLSHNYGKSESLARDTANQVIEQKEKDGKQKNLQEKENNVGARYKIKDGLCLSSIVNVKNCEVNLELVNSKQIYCVRSAQIRSNMQQPIDVKAAKPVSTHPLSSQGQTSVDDPLHKWKINKYFQSTLPDEKNEYQEHNMPPQTISNLSEASNMPSTLQSFDTQSNSSVESMDIIMYPSKSVLLEIEKSKKLHSKKLSNKHKNDIPKKIQNSNSKNKLKISKKVLGQKLKKNISNEPSKQTKKHLKPLQKNLPVTNKTSLASCTTVMLKPESLENPVPLDSRSDQSTVIKQKKSTVKKRAENYGSRTKFLLSDMEYLEQKSKQPKVTKQISLTKSNKDSKKSSMNNLTVPSSKLNQCDSKTQEISTDNLKTNNTTLEHVPHMPKSRNTEFELAEYDPEIELEKESHLQQNILNNAREVLGHVCANVSESLNICSKNELNTITSHLETTKICTDKKLPEASMTSKSNKDNPKNSNNMCAIITSEDFCIKLIKIIVEFNPKWLFERYVNVEPPPDVSKGAKSLPLSFDSFDLYASHLFPMLILEVWEELSFYSNPILINSSEKKFYFCILSYEYVNGMMLLNCESIVNETVSFVPKKNNAVILHLKEIGGRDIPSFGFIKHHEFKTLDQNYVHLHKWQHLPENWIKSAKLYSYKIYAKCRVLNLMDCLFEGNGICNLRKKLMLSNALNHLKFSPLIKDILLPTLSTFTVPYKQEKNCCDYNSIQENICSAVCNVMTLPPSVPKIILLQGPPGSGKTTSVACIAEKLCKDFNMKVLIVAPSNFAVDEIGHQLVQLNEMADNPIHFIRLGSSKSPKLLLHLFENVLRMHQVRYEIEYLQYQHDLKMTEDKLHYLQGNQNIENCDEKYTQALNEFELIQGKQLKKWDHSVEKTVMMNILQNSKIILSTITDCFLYFKIKHSLKFSHCIIDEINQATELDVLFPFALEINKFLLVGDPKQLAPVVKSKLALRYGFQQSILERFQLYFKMKNGFNPAIILTKQFRMQTQISDFPLQYFYSQDSKLCSYADKRSKDFPFKPYAVFHDVTELRADKLFKYEMLGIEAIMCFCSLFIKFHSLSSIAIIVPSEQEREMYLPEVVKKFPHSAIEVDTLESFQGREKSIIILACFKDISSGLDDYESIFCDERNLNVALTRAVNTLVICGPIHRFLKHKLWHVLIHWAQWQGCYTYYTHLNDYSQLFEEYLLKK